MKEEKKTFTMSNEEEIAEEFGVFQSMQEKDFFIYHLLKAAESEKNKEKERNIPKK